MSSLLSQPREVGVREESVVKYTEKAQVHNNNTVHCTSVHKGEGLEKGLPQAQRALHQAVNVSDGITRDLGVH
jgi:hypothetical protein